MQYVVFVTFLGTYGRVMQVFTYTQSQLSVSPLRCRIVILPSHLHCASAQKLFPARFPSHGQLAGLEGMWIDARHELRAHLKAHWAYCMVWAIGVLLLLLLNEHCPRLKWGEVYNSEEQYKNPIPLLFPPGLQSRLHVVIVHLISEPNQEPTRWYQPLLHIVCSSRIDNMKMVVGSRSLFSHKDGNASLLQNPS